LYPGGFDRACWSQGETFEERFEDKDLVRHMMSGLRPRHRKAVELRFGFGGHDPMTYDEIGSHFGVTRERVRQMVFRAMKEMERAGLRELRNIG
jgi:RNA polymerase primary sigma factor